jgi:hypothetical protein
MHADIVRQKQRLDDTFDKVKAWIKQCDHDAELQSHLARYLCVLVRTIVGDYARRQASPRVADYVVSQLRSFQNAKSEKILRLVEQFDAGKAHRLSKATEGGCRDAVDSVVANRHQIAHGQSTNISFATMHKYYQTVWKTLQAIDAEFQ